MILLCGIASEPPMARVAEALEELDEPYVFFHQRRWAQYSLTGTISDAGLAGRLRLGSVQVDLADVRAVYTRLMDDRRLPEVVALADGAPERRWCHELHRSLATWQEVTVARVINRAAAQASNASKPYQSQLIRRHGLRIPETLITDDPERVLAFRSQHGRLVYKSISGIRSIVRELGDDDLARLERIRWCPTQFQARVAGEDVRVHCVGERAFASRIISPAVDYRYAHQDAGLPVRVEATGLEDELAERCVALTRSLGLELSGIDLRLAPDGEAYCFEVNPSPAFSYYEAMTGQPIARAIAEHLARA